MYELIFDKLMCLRLCGQYSQKSGWAHRGQQLSFNLLVMVEEGSCTFNTSGNIYSLKKGDIIFIPKRTWYAPYTNTECKYKYFWFEAEIEAQTNEIKYYKIPSYDTVFSTAPAHIVLPQTTLSDNKIDFYLNEIISDMLENDTVSDVKMNINFYNALLTISEKNLISYSSTVNKIKNYISDNLQSPLLLSDLSKVFGYTKQHIVRIFKNAFGITPIMFANQERLKQSISLLIET